MTIPNHPEDRIELLADIAEMYFMEGKNQSQIADLVGMTRSNISRLLKEARESGVVKIQINRSVNSNPALAQQLVERFNLMDARIIDIDDLSQLLPKLGKVAGKELIKRLKAGSILGTALGV